MAKETWLWLAAGLGWGALNSGEVLAAFPGGAEAIAANLYNETLNVLLTPRQRERLSQSAPADFIDEVAGIEAKAMYVLPYDDAKYPAALQLINNPPPVLFAKGDLSLLNGQLAVGIVGARRPSAYGVEAVKTLGNGLALGGAVIVSGLAAGLDSEAHKAALTVNGPTIACIAFGHDHCYPAANRRLMDVIEHTGVVVSEYPPGTTPEKSYFLQRNRIIAGLSHGLVVVEARRYSGTMSTVNFAVDYGREVFAVPGPIFSELSSGTNDMIREGAHLAGSADDVLRVFGTELGEEDLAQAISSQAADGKPEPAPAPPLWPQGLNPQQAQSAAGDAADGGDAGPSIGVGASSKQAESNSPGSASQQPRHIRKFEVGQAARQATARPKPQKEPDEHVSDTAKQVYGQLGVLPISLAGICEKSGLSSAQVMAALTELELAGLSSQLAGRQFVIAQ